MNRIVIILIQRRSFMILYGFAVVEYLHNGRQNSVPADSRT